LFCEKCRSIVFPKDGKYVCKRCGFEYVKPTDSSKTEKKTEEDTKKDNNGEENEKLGTKSDEAQENDKKELQEAIEDEVPIVGKSTITLSKAKVICEECGHGEAYYYIRQTRSADEPSTTFYRCCKCNHSWREN